MMLAISDYSLEISCHNTKLHFCRPDEIKEVTRCDVKLSCWVTGFIAHDTVANVSTRRLSNTEFS